MRQGDFDWTSYHTLEEIYDWLDNIVEEHSSIASSVIGGMSYEKRQIKGVHIKFNEVIVKYYFIKN